MTAHRIKLSYPFTEDRFTRNFFARLKEIGDSTLSEVAAGYVEEDYEDLVWQGETSTIETLQQKQIRNLGAAALSLYASRQIKLSLLYMVSPRNLRYAFKQIQSNSQKPRGGIKERKIPWGEEGLATYLDQHYPVTRLTFDIIGTEPISSQKGVYQKGVVLGLSQPKAEEHLQNSNQAFFDAQTLCTDILGRYRKAAQFTLHRTVRIGEINMTSSSLDELPVFLQQAQNILPITLNVGKIKPSYSAHID